MRHQGPIYRGKYSPARRFDQESVVRRKLDYWCDCQGFADIGVELDSRTTILMMKTLITPSLA